MLFDLRRYFENEEFKKYFVLTYFDTDILVTSSFCKHFYKKYCPYKQFNVNN